MFIFPDTSKPLPNIHVNNNRAVPTNNENVGLEQNSCPSNNMQNSSDFINDLCWDVDSYEGEGDAEMNNRTISLRIKVTIMSNEIWVLIDSGSDNITCVSERFYDMIKSHMKIPELPISNLGIFVAVGKKTINIRKKIQLTLKIHDFEVMYVFLVVPNLSTEMIFGIDILSKSEFIINFKEEIFELCGKKYHLS